MKKLLLLITSFTLGGTTFSQINFDYTDLQEAETTYITKTDTLTSVNIGTASPTSQAWDFTNLTMHFMSGPSFDLTSNTTYTSDYPNSDLYTYGPAIMFGGFSGGVPVGEQGMDNGYMFWRKDVTGFWTEGFMAEDGPLAGRKVYTVPQEMILGTPTTLATSYTNHSQWSINFDLVSTDVDTVYTSTVDKTQLCDAWGSLETPTGLFPDVLRIHEYVIKADTVRSYLMGNLVYTQQIMRDTLNNYIFLAKNIHYPIAIVKADKNDVVKSVEYYFNQGPLGTNEQKQDLSVQIFPNPTSNMFNVNIGKDISNPAYIILFDIQGKQVLKHTISSSQNQIDCSTLNSGVYFYEIMLDSEKVSGKIFIE
jgi:hypothetical protein